MKRPDDIDVVNLAQFGTRENGRSTSTSTCPSSGRTDPCSTTQIPPWANVEQSYDGFTHDPKGRRVKMALTWRFGA